MDELIVECPNRSLGCTHTCQRLLLSAHVKESCQYVEVPCAEESCGKTVLRKDLGVGGHPHKQASDAKETSEEAGADKLDAGIDPKEASIFRTKDSFSSNLCLRCYSLHILLVKHP